MQTLRCIAGLLLTDGQHQTVICTLYTAASLNFGWRYLTFL
jgi:hypothetical protein